MAHPTPDQSVRIHKYPNRRYYDTAASRYVTLEQLHEMICGGREIRVSDSRTGQDITAKVLAQIIIEAEPGKLNAIPLHLLHALIRANARAIGSAYQRYVDDAMSAFRNSQRSIEQGMRQAMDFQSGPNAMIPDWLRMVWGPLAPPSFLFTGRGASANPPVTESEPDDSAAPPTPHQPGDAPPANGTSANTEPAAGELPQLIQQLRERLGALEARLGKKPRRKNRRGSRRAKKSPRA